MLTLYGTQFCYPNAFRDQITIPKRTLSLPKKKSIPTIDIAVERYVLVKGDRNIQYILLVDGVLSPHLSRPDEKERKKLILFNAPFSTLSLDTFNSLFSCCLPLVQTSADIHGTAEPYPAPTRCRRPLMLLVWVCGSYSASTSIIGEDRNLRPGSRRRMQQQQQWKWRRLWQ